MMIMQIQEESDLYHRFEHARLSGDAYQYIQSRFLEIPITERKDAVLEIHCPKTVRALKVQEALRRSVRAELTEMDRTLSTNKFKMIRLYVIGVLLVVLGITLALTLDQLLLEIISIVGSMAIKDAATIQIEHNPEIRFRKRILEQLENIPITAVQTLEKEGCA